MSAKIAKRARSKHDRQGERNGTVGRFHVELELANNEDMILAKAGHLESAKIRRTTVQAVVDTGATLLVLPKHTSDELGLASTAKLKERYADHRRGTRGTVENVWLKLLGRDGIFRAIVEPKLNDALIGAIVMEQLDLLVDPALQKLVPRDPSGIVTEVE
jgi:predicted aspartyl protease